jgi:phage shock protein PspC (stress-responsive transcriptional regulator)
MTGSGKVLRRPHQGRIIGGVAAAFGQFFGINPIWFRLAFLLALLPGGLPGLLIYLICWIIIPSET